jgi:hypothetical protein
MQSQASGSKEVSTGSSILILSKLHCPTGEVEIINSTSCWIFLKIK